jgi:peptidyl-prolyl cis-trans isomerase SurA
MLKFIIRRLALIQVLVAIALSCAAASYAETLDRVLVIVNDDIITLDDFEKATGQMKKSLRAQGEQVPADSVLKESVLEQLVFEKLLQQHAVTTGINVTDSMLDQAVQNVAAQNNMSVTDVLQKLERDGLSEKTFRESLKNQLLVQRVIDRDVKSRISVLDSEVEGILRNMQQGQADRAYNVSIIQFAVSDDADPQEMQQVTDQASALRSRIEQGQVSFESAARKFSAAVNASEGGSLGWKTADQLPEVFAQVLSKMAAGSLSEPLSTPAGVYLLKLNEVKGSQQKMVSQTRARHILLKASNKVDIEHAREEIQKIRERIISGENFAAIATDISQDTGSAIKGGDLGWLNKGDTVPPFERAMDTLQPGELSQPVVSRFGVHLIRVEERREVDVSEIQRKAVIREQIAKRKIAEKYDQFLKQLKSAAYIDYRVPLEEL